MPLTRREALLVGATAFIGGLVVAGSIYFVRRTNFVKEDGGFVDQDGIVTEIPDNNDDAHVDDNRCKRRWLGEEHLNESVCKPWCLGRKDETHVCEWKDCSGCYFCLQEEKAQAEFCPDWCNYMSFSEEHEGQVCNYDWATNCSSCGCATFIDVTKYKLPITDHFFHQWYHSGKPYSHENGPIFLDLNGDGILEYFDTMHAHPLPENASTKIPGNRFELTESVLYDFVEDDVILSNDLKDLKDMYRYRHVGYRIHIIEDETTGNMDLDPHGQNILDLDGDGVLDMMISSGGSRGMMDVKYTSYARARNNFLLWGEKQGNVDKVTGEPTTVFRGGRDTSEAAGVHMAYGRGRINYMMDMNQDGLIDIFCLQIPPVNNLLIPGVILFNNGNRTWSPDASMREYAATMILTDADGDGLAQELVLVRGHCYPEREGPQIDPTYPEYGPYTKEVKDFCRTRPVGTIAVYKYNKKIRTMEELSPLVQTKAQKKDQTMDCPTSVFLPGLVDCNARSLASGDFDGDLIADLVVMYDTRLEFFLSSDRKEEEKGTNVAYRDPSSVLDYTDDKCHAGRTIRLVDIDNDGRQEILVACRLAGHYRLFTRGEDKDVWHRESPCSAEGALGDLENTTLVKPTDSDFGHLCNCLSHKCEHWGHAKEGCEYYKGERDKMKLQMEAFSAVDLNNDGFVDFVSSHNFGYTKFFHNVPRMAARRNRFITFQLVGNGPGKKKNSNNVYGIGATIILYGERRQRQSNSNKVDDPSTNEPHHQFREKSTYQHATDGLGSVDDRITFGLGIDIFPLNVTVRWPNGHETVLDLHDAWAFEPENYPIVIGE